MRLTAIPKTDAGKVFVVSVSSFHPSPKKKKSFPSYAAYEKTTFAEYLTNGTLNM